MTRKMTPMIVLNVPPKSVRRSRARHGGLDVGSSDHDERERADPRPFDPDEASDHGHDQEVDRLRQVDVAGRDLTVPPDVEDAGEGGEEGREAEGERPMQRHVVAERGHAQRLVADALEADPERRPNDERMRT